MYTISLRKRAIKEYLESTIWYKERSLAAAENFIKSVNEAFSKLEIKPAVYKNSYKHFHEIKLTNYPFAVVYFIDQKKMTVVITTLFHFKRNPKRKFGR